MEDIRNFTYEELKDLFEKKGHKEYRVKQLFKWLYDRCCKDFDNMTDLSKKFREELKSCYSINSLILKDTLLSQDGTRKFLFEAHDGGLIEAVLIPDEKRYTICISSQLGCAMDCKFCNTGNRGFERNLETWEILAQLIEIILATGIKPNNIVFMGMGEPLANYDNVLKALKVLQNPGGFNYSQRKITVSTSGLADKIERLGKDVVVKLAVSLNATTDKERSKIMPINKKFPIQRLLEALKSYPLPKNSEITIEYVLLEGVNDTPDDAKRLYELLKGVKTKVNLILFNRWENSRFTPPSLEHALAFQRMLWNLGMRVLMRESKGKDIMAACGQLRGMYKNVN